MKPHHWLRVSGVSDCCIFFQLPRLVFFEVCYRLVMANRSPHSALSPPTQLLVCQRDKSLSWAQRTGSKGVRGQRWRGAQTWKMLNRSRWCTERAAADPSDRRSMWDVGVSTVKVRIPVSQMAGRHLARVRIEVRRGSPQLVLLITDV